MKHFKLLAVCLLTVFLLCACAQRSTVAGQEEAADRLTAYLHDFVYSQNDTYSCRFLDEQEQDGETVYRFEAFWEEDGEKYSLGNFSVFPDGTVTPDE